MPLNNSFELLGKLEHAQSQPERTDLFHTAIRETVLYCDLTVLDLSQKFDISLNEARKWINGESCPDVDFRAGICESLIHTLITGEKNWR